MVPNEFRRWLIKQRNKQKRKRQHAPSQGLLSLPIDTSKPTAVYHADKGREHTVSVALPSSIIAIAHTHDQKCALAGQVARALAVFSIDEVVIFDDGYRKVPSSHSGLPETQDARKAEDSKTGYTAFSDPTDFLTHILSYLETPPYLRRALMPFHPNLKTAGALPSLDMPHHLRADEWCKYREGVVVENFATPEALDGTGSRGLRNAGQRGQAALVDVGLESKVTVPVAIPPKTRVTLKFDDQERHRHSSHRNLRAEAVSPDAPRRGDGYYWGFTIRQAASLSKVFTESSFSDGYDFCIGTSERGQDVQGLMSQVTSKVGDVVDVCSLSWMHLLVVFGGLAGLEQALSNDPELGEKGVKDPKELFDEYVNILEGQGSRTIRTEEALFIGLARLQEFIRRRN